MRRFYPYEILSTRYILQYTNHHLLYQNKYIRDHPPEHLLQFSG